MPGVPATAPRSGAPRYDNADAANFAPQVNAITDAIDAAMALLVEVPPVGSIVAYAGTGDPAGGKWLLADGRAVSRTTYAALFTALGTAYGAGDGNTTFNLPDLRGRVPVGADSMGTAAGAAARLTDTLFDSRGESGGEEKHRLSTAEMPSHNHTATASTATPNAALSTDGSHTHTITLINASNTYVVWGSGNYLININAQVTTDPAGAHTHTLPNYTAAAQAIAATGGGGLHNNMQPGQIANYIVRVA